MSLHLVNTESRFVLEAVGQSSLIRLVSTVN